MAWPESRAGGGPVVEEGLGEARDGARTRRCLLDAPPPAASSTPASSYSSLPFSPRSSPLPTRTTTLHASASSPAASVWCWNGYAPLIKIIVDDAPCLERLLFESFSERRRPVKIVHTSRLEVLGFLDFQLHTLEIGGTVIRSGMTMKDGAMLPSLKILAVKVRFSHDKEVKMLHTLLRCFPCLETLHIMSIPSWSADRGDCAETWNSMGSSNCLSHLKTFLLHGFQGLDREQLFVSYILEKGIKTLGIVCGDSDSVLVKGNAPSGGSSGSGISVCPASGCWSFQHAVDLSVEDPFCVLRRDKARIASFTEAMRLCASLGC